MKKIFLSLSFPVILLLGVIVCFISCTKSSPIANLPMKQGKFAASDSSLEQYQYPKWFCDGKLGFWAHWGPQAVPRQGDWYARKMYIEENYNRHTGEKYGKSDKDYIYHKEHYGPQSKFGYKNIIPLWKAQRFDPDALMKLYKACGAKYFVSMGTHHDNFFLWNSKLHRWNSVNMGPHRDIVGDWQKAAKKYGLHFGVSEHLGASFTWFQTSHGADTNGKYKGIPYDGNDPEYQDLYHWKADSADTGWYSTNQKWQRQWYDEIKELVDNYKPELLYSDGCIPFSNKVGRTMIAHLYNTVVDDNGNTKAVYNCKEASNGRFVRDVERGAMDGIQKYPWQTDTSIGDWFYKTGQKYKTSNQIVQMLVDIVSKNGNLLINIVQTPEGDLEPDVLNILSEFKVWMNDNSAGIYSTRPWKIYGEGPTTTKAQPKNQFGGIKDVRPYCSEDIRYTQKDGDLYAFVMQHPESDITLSAFAFDGVAADSKVKSVEMLGSSENVLFTQSKKGLIIRKPSKLPKYDVTCFKISFE